MPVDPVPAATVALLRDAPQGPEVLLVRRQEGAGPFPGASVFPGGMVDSEDANPALAPPNAGFRVDLAKAAVGNTIPPEVLRALYVAACRELFEEADILVARDEDGGPLPPEAVERLASSRARLQEGTFSFVVLLRSLRLVLGLGDLVPLAHWITPEHQARRWNTLFLLAAAPSGQIERADGTETSVAVWLRPVEALAAYARGEHLLAPPTFRVLEELSSFASVSEAISRTHAAGPLPANLPVPLDHTSDLTLALPGDCDYPGCRSAARNRIVLCQGRWRSIRET